MRHENAEPNGSGSKVPAFPKEGGQEQEVLHPQGSAEGHGMTSLSYFLAAVSCSVSLTAAAMGSWVLVLAGLYTLFFSYVIYMASQED